jgi:eukaryotic-like serine/threonine-protein kinase
VGYFRAAVALRPASAAAHNELGAALHGAGDLDTAIAEYRKAIGFDPRWSAAYANLGNALDAKGDFNGAVAEYRKALALEPKHARTHYNYAVALHTHGQLDDAVVEFREALALDPNYTTAYYGLGLALFGKRDLDGAAAAYRKALALNPQFAEAHCNLGAVLREQGALADSLAEYRRGHKLGSRQPGWRYPSPEWIRQGERLLQLDTKLSLVLRREAKPADAAEWLALAEFCQKPSKRFHAAAANLYTKAFAAEPSLADGPRLPHRYNAACSAVLAAAGHAADTKDLPDQARQMLRRQALGWLHGDLAQYAKLAERDDPKTKDAVRQQLGHWQQDTDLVTVRDQEALDRLSDDERKEWRQLWDEVATLLKQVQEKK